MIRHAMVMMAGTLLSRITGLVREVVVAGLFGASRSMDAFNVAYTLANLARQLLAEGALSAAFVPVFSQVLERDGIKSALRLARSAMTVLLIMTLIVVSLGILGSDFLTRIMAPGFDAETASIASRLTKYMFPFLIFISLEALTMGELNSLGSFFVPALSPAFSNITFIITAPLFTGLYGVYGLAFSVICGGAAHFLTQWLWSFKLNAVLYPDLKPDLKNKDLRRMMKLFLPYAAGLSLNQINPVISRMLGSFLQAGSISVLNYANRILQLPLGLFVIAISQAVLPQLSRAKSPEDFRDILRQALRFALFIILPAALGVILISSQFVHLIFVRGEFNNWAWDATSSCLALGMLGLPGMACSTIVMRALYALEMPRAAFNTTLFSVSATALFSLMLLPMGYNGLALAPGIAFTLSGLYGLYKVKLKLNLKLNIINLSWLIKSVLALSLMALLILIIKFIFPYDAGLSLSLRALWILGVILICVIVYIFIALCLKFEELGMIKRAFIKKRA